MDRILLFLEHKENRRLLKDWLAKKCRVALAGTEQALDEPFDLAILDGPALCRLWEQVQARKEAEQPVFLPFLLVTSRRDAGLVTRRLWRTTVDELILTPIEKVELQARVEILLRARKLSLESEQRYFTLADSSPAGIFILQDERIVYVNPAFMEISGRSLKQAAGAHFLDFVHPDDRASIAKYYQDWAVGKEKAESYAVRFPAAEQVRWAELGLTPISYHGKPAILGIALDITERMRAAEETRQRAQEFAALNAVATATTSTLELSEILELALEQAMALTGLEGGTICLIPPGQDTLHLAVEHEASPGMVAGLTQNVVKIGECLCGDAAQTQQPVILWEDAPASPLAREAARGEGINFHGAFPLVVQERSIGVLCVFTRTAARPARRSLEVLQIACGQIAIAIENARLYDEARQFNRELEARIAAATEEIGRRAGELAALHEFGKEITATLDLDTRLQAIADNAVRLVRAGKSLILLIDAEREKLVQVVGHGYSRGQLNGYTFEEFQDGLSGWVLQEKAPTLSADIQTDERNRGQALTSARRSGDRSAAVAPLLIGDEVIGTLTVVNRRRGRAFTPANLDLVTMLAGQAAVAIQNARLYEAAQEANRLKSAFLAIVSHELRTPLNSIIGFTGILLQGLAGSLNDEQIKQLGMVRSSARHLLDLINDILDISKIEAGQLEITSKSFDMREAVEKAVRAVTPLAEEKGLALVARVAPGVGQVTSDRRRVEQVLINLINNAVKFTGKGEVQVECQVSDGWLVTRVVDMGIGIKSEDMGNIFEPFRQIETGAARRHEGTGLGLSICQRLVEMLGGEIWVESEGSGKGSTFTFTLPNDLS